MKLSDSPCLQIRVRNFKLFFCLFINQTYVVGAQKNRLNETVLLSIKTYVLTYELESNQVLS